MKSDNQKKVLPGDALAVSEEFLPGRNAYDANGTIRALLMGTMIKDLGQREVSVKPAVAARMPDVGDIVTGQIETAQSSVSNLKIYYVNGTPTAAGFVGLIFLREERGGRGARRTQVRLGDIVRAKVVSTVNAMIHLSINEPRLGVIATLCSNCGRPISDQGGRARCNECGNQEDRKFADDFGREPIQP
ncbi:MAG: exosome complex RNA-binding protein Csl4 [Nitrososphaerota archaeon]|jgi:exosome complex component CSL4|nr:exosome complex RNA-binding protein Csl4 [Nitrososphaerota archaeon]